MSLRLLVILLVGCFFSLTSWIVTPTALAVVPIKLSNLSYQDCPQEFAQGNVTSGGSAMPANCFMVTGQAQNNSGKMVYDADVYGQIYDAYDEPILQNRSRLGSIPKIPPGVSDFELRISVPANQPTPLKLDKFKASGFSSTVVPAF